ncbi:S9 family peptidase [Brevundimonas sp. SORGH_AS_0993]|uniref:alpha/beta hydrolase family protein n=1 Tax=Brevundimonas sp. SORGH_AS_0993 TaxID=3041794 RepID=UPI00278B42D0|nr:alpha/beta fold hydrolase [Brevundimonas sp. SORGH_AS_0993]MDQ1153923.1 pimeloyl-ACP methyl ester carboxylesterase [Brevundimonas sp. SORGH_AS_0993]
MFRLRRFSVGRTAAALIAPALLAGCMSVNVPESAFFYPNARVAAEKIELPTDRPMAFPTDRLNVAYAGGPVGVTRVRTGRADAPLILYCGGNLFRRSSGAGTVASELAPFGDVVTFDYPGYGETAGQADYAAFVAVGTAVADAVRDLALAEHRKVIVWGHSLGGPVCAQAASLVRADAVVLETTTPSTRAAVDAMVGWVRPLVKVNIAPNLAAIDVPAALKDYRGRVLVLEAGRDDTLPPALSRVLARDLQRQGVDVRRLVFPQAGHGDVGRQPDFQPRIAEALTGL